MRKLAILSLAFLLLCSTSKAASLKGIEDFLEIYSAFLNSHSISSQACQILGNDCLEERDEELCHTSIVLCAVSGHRSEAMRIAQEAVKAIPKSSKLWYQLGRLLILSNRIIDGEDALEKACSLDPKNKDAYELLIKLLLFTGETKRALRVVNQLQKKLPNDPDVFFYKGKIYYKLGETDKAFREIKKAFDLGCKKRECLFLLAKLYMEKGEFKKASSFFERLISTGKISDEIIRLLLSSYLQSGQFSKAEHILERLYSIRKNKELAISLGMVYLKLNRQKKLENLCNSYPKMLPCIVKACISKKQLDYAAELDYQTLVESARISMDLGKMECASYFLKLALVKNPEESEIYVQLAMIHYFNNEKDKAVKSINAAIALNPKESDYYFRKGVILEKFGEIRESIKALKKAVELSSSPNPTYLNYLGYLLIVRDIDVKEGIRLVKEALKVSPKNPSYLDSLAWGYFKEGRIKEALEIQKKVYEKEPDNAVIAYHLGEIYWKLGMKKKAIELFRKAKKLLTEEKNLSPWERESIDRRLQQLLH